MERAVIARLLQRIAANRPTREIDSEGEPYLRRVYLAHWGGWRVYLHKFVGGVPAQIRRCGRGALVARPPV